MRRTHVLVDEARGVGPVGRGAVQRVPKVESRRGNGLKLFAEENVLLRLVGEDQPQLRLISWIGENCANDLQARSDASAYLR